MNRRVRERVVGVSVEDDGDGVGRELIVVVVVRWLGSKSVTAGCVTCYIGCDMRGKWVTPSEFEGYPIVPVWCCGGCGMAVCRPAPRQGDMTSDLSFNCH
jgi:hypothetical protein